MYACHIISAFFGYSLPEQIDIRGIMILMVLCQIYKPYWLARKNQNEKNIVTKRTLSRQIKKYCTMIEEIKSWRQNKPIVYNWTLQPWEILVSHSKQKFHEDITITWWNRIHMRTGISQRAKIILSSRTEWQEELESKYQNYSKKTNIICKVWNLIGLTKATDEFV